MLSLMYICLSTQTVCVFVDPTHVGVRGNFVNIAVSAPYRAKVSGAAEGLGQTEGSVLPKK